MWPQIGSHTVQLGLQTAEQAVGKKQQQNNSQYEKMPWCHLGGWKLASTHCQMACVMFANLSLPWRCIVYVCLSGWSNPVAGSDILSLTVSHASHVTQYLKFRHSVFKTTPSSCLISVQHATCFSYLETGWWFLMPPFHF